MVSDIRYPNVRCGVHLPGPSGLSSSEPRPIVSDELIVERNVMSEGRRFVRDQLFWNIRPWPRARTWAAPIEGSQSFLARFSRTWSPVQG
jgi:hypothetical protein